MNGNVKNYWDELNQENSWNACSCHQDNLKRRALRLISELDEILEELEVTYEEIRGINK